jgi:hypothetical protein
VHQLSEPPILIGIITLMLLAGNMKTTHHSGGAAVETKKHIGLGGKDRPEHKERKEG